MLKNYFTLIRRQIIRQPIHVSLILSCLSIGIAAALLILMYLNFETNYDRFHAQADDIYRVETRVIQTKTKAMDVQWNGCPGLLNHYIQQDYPEVKASARIFQFFNNESPVFEFDDQSQAASDILVADSSILDIFTFNFIQGDPNSALEGPNKIILSKAQATRFFGDQNPIGKTLKTQLSHILPDTKSDYSLIVSGVYEDFPANSHLDIQGLISAATDPRLNDYYFKRFSFYTYVLLNPQIDASRFSDKLSDIYKKYLDPDIEPTMKYAVHELVPLTEIYMTAAGGFTYIYIFASIGILMLLISAISYINLITAQASKRAKEIGIRKVMGSSRGQLISQFLSESLFYSLIATFIAIGLIYLTLPQLNASLNLELSFAQLAQSNLLLGIVGIIGVIGILGGSYPAFFLSAYQAIQNLKSKSVKGAPIRRALVGVQFAVVIFVLISTVMIYEQLDFLRNKDLGFDRDQVVRIFLSDEIDRSKTPALKNTITANPLIKSVCTSNFLTGTWMFRRPLSADGAASQDPQFVHFGNIDYDYFKTMGIDILAGRPYSSDHPADATDHIIINEALARNFGLENPIGEKVRFGDQGNPNFRTVIGVVNDFHQSSLHEEIASQMFILNPNQIHLAVNIQQDIPEAIAHIEKSWKEVFPLAPFEYHFLNADLERGYQLDQIRGNIFLLFSGITLFIAFLGLFGLAAYMSRQRIKEIGIRKVLGARTQDVVTLLSKEFILLTLIAAIPASILAWYFINQWLMDFAYRTDINFMVFALVLIFTLTLTLLTTGFHAVLASNRNPADTLKEE